MRLKDKENPVSSNKLPVFTNGHALRGHSFIYNVGLYRYYCHEYVSLHDTTQGTS